MNSNMNQNAFTGTLNNNMMQGNPQRNQNNQNANNSNYNPFNF